MKSLRASVFAAKLALRGSFEWTPRTLGLVFRSSRSGTLTVGGLSLLASLLPLAVAYVGKRIVDAVVAHSTTQALRWVILEFGCVAAMGLASQGLILVRQIVGARLGLDINLLILKAAIGLDLHHFEDSEFYDRLTRARREASQRPLSIVTRSFQILQNSLSLIGFAVLLLHFSGWAVFALLLSAIPATISELRFSNKAFRLRNWRSAESRKLLYLEHVLANNEHAKEVKLLSLGPVLLDRYRDLGETFYREDRELNVRRGRWAYLLSICATATFYACYAAVALAAVGGRVTLGEMTLDMMAFRQGQQSFQALLAALSGMYEDNLYMSNLFAYLEVGTRVVPLPLAPVPEITQEKGIRFRDVGFRYPGRDEWALRHLSVFIPEGQSLALVGQNGAGKTTFIKLLTRLYDPVEGEILLDGRLLTQWDAERLHERISIVFQDFARYQLTARENVGFGEVQNLKNDAQVTRAIERGGAETVVGALKAGIETQIGRWFKDGVELSGGQWQKIALARAFMRESADILVLDEPTAALDAEAEHAVFQRFRELTQGKTSILISHRFPTVRMADRILVIDRGQVVEEGTHDSLVSANGRYAHLFALQAQGYE
jgi:ATP-binding cassette, subfamily B, bacterial